MVIGMHTSLYKEGEREREREREKKERVCTSPT